MASRLLLHILLYDPARHILVWVHTPIQWNPVIKHFCDGHLRTTFSMNMSLNLSFLTSQPHLTLQTRFFSLTHSLPLVFMPLLSPGFLPLFECSFLPSVRWCFFLCPVLSCCSLLGFQAGRFSHSIHSCAAISFFSHGFDHRLCLGLKSLPWTDVTLPTGHVYRHLNST